MVGEVAAGRSASSIPSSAFVPLAEPSKATL